MNEMKLSEFIAKFEYEGISDLELFPELTKKELKECGFRIGHLKKWGKKYPFVSIYSFLFKF
jgi:hypothetical protein